jgi:Zn-dependent protease
MRTKGIYFIPFFGGAAVAEDDFPSRRSEAMVALAGPLWGLGLTMAAAALYFFYRTPLLAAVSGWMAALNLFNLLPINPLDGGRVVKSIAYSVHTGAGHAILIFSMVALGILMWILQMPFFALLIICGIVEFLAKSPRKKDLTPSQMGWLGIAYLGLICVLWMVMYAMRAVPGAELAMTLFKMD